MSVATSRHLRVDNGTHQASPRAGTSSGKEYATVYVAASNSHQDAKDTADFVCDGTLDEDEINAAIQVVWDAYFGDGSTDDNGVPLGIPGGRVILAEGTYNISFSGISGATHEFSPGFPTVGVWPPVVIQGQGPGTVLLCTNTRSDGALLLTYVFTGYTDSERIAFRDLVFDGNAAIDRAGPGAPYCPVYAQALHLDFDNVIFRNLVGQNFAQVEMSGGTRSARFRGCRWESPHPTIIGNWASCGLYLACNEGATVEGCSFVDQDGDGAIIGAGDDIVIAGNVIEGAGFRCVSLSFGSGHTIEGNTVDGFADGGIYAVDGVVAANVVTGVAGYFGTNGIGIFVQGDRCIVAGNTVKDCAQHGILVDSHIDVAVHGNLVYRCGQAGDNLYDGIRLATADRCSVQGNTVRHGGGTIRHKYGINVSNAASDNNFVTNNDLKDSGRSGSFNNAGTGTVTTAGNRL